jgi:phosphohistidine phosphatase
MQLYLLRHGIAEEYTATTDADRALTAEGISKLESLLISVKPTVQPELILTSPYKRALQTAELAKQILDVSADLVCSDAFTPDVDVREAWEEIRLFREFSSILIASHNPLCSYLSAFLLNSPNLILDFKKGMLVQIELDRFSTQPHGILKFVFPARLAR